MKGSKNNFARLAYQPIDSMDLWRNPGVRFGVVLSRWSPWCSLTGKDKVPTTGLTNLPSRLGMA